MKPTTHENKAISINTLGDEHKQETVKPVYEKPTITVIPTAPMIVVENFSILPD